MIRVTVWDEDLQTKDEKIRAVYPEGMRGAIADGLKDNPTLEVRLVHADMPEYGLPDQVLEQTDVLVWWAHRTHKVLPDEFCEKIKQHVLNGMGFIALHSAHLSKPFMSLMGTSCSLKYRYEDRARIWTTEPTHPIARGIPEVFELEIEEAYGEFFDVPRPDDVVFTSWFEGGSLFRGGCTWTRGLGKIFYFHVGHDTYPTYHNPYVQKIIENAVLWAMPNGPRRELVCIEEPAYKFDSKFLRK